MILFISISSFLAMSRFVDCIVLGPRSVSKIDHGGRFILTA